MHVLVAGLQANAETQQAAQSVGDRGPVRLRPERVGNHNGISAQRRLLPVALGQSAKGGLKARAAHLFLGFPKKLKVEAHAILQGQASPKERGQGWPLVVGGAAAAPLVTLADQLEGRRPPLVGFRGLHIQVIVDGHRRELGVLHQTSEDQGQSRRLDTFGLRSQFAQQRTALLRDPLHVGPTRRIHAHRRNFHQSGEFLLELAAQTGAASAQVRS